MNPKLHKFLLEMENKDWDTNDYFSWSEQEKQQLTENIMLMFGPIAKTNGVQRNHILNGLYSSMKDAEDIEDYEQADILKRCLYAVEKIVFHSIY